MRNQLAWISTHAIRAFFITSNAFFPCSPVVKKFFKISNNTINHKIKFAMFLIMFQMRKSGASKPNNDQYTILLSSANQARARAGQIKRYNPLSIELYMYILSWTYELSVAAATLSTPSNQKNTCIPPQIAMIATIFVKKDDLCMDIIPNIKYLSILSAPNISNLFTIKTNTTLAKNVFLYIDRTRRQKYCIVVNNLLFIIIMAYLFLCYDRVWYIDDAGQLFLERNSLDETLAKLLIDRIREHSIDTLLIVTGP